MTRGRPNEAAHVAQLRREVANLDDLMALEEGTLARLGYFQRKAEQEYRGRTCSIGHAVAGGLRAMLTEVAADLPNTPVGALAAGIADGRTQVEIATALGITPQHLTRRYKPVLLSILWQKVSALR